MYEQIPVEILERHQGQWIIWDQDDQKVVGAATTLEEAEDQARSAPEGHLLRIHHVLPAGTEIAGML